MQEKLKRRPAREILEDLAKNLGLEVLVKRLSKLGMTTCLRLKHQSYSNSYAYVLDKDIPSRRIFSGWGFDETGAADDALSCILRASKIYWVMTNAEMMEFTEVDLSSIYTVEELEIAIDLGSLKISSRQYLSPNNDPLSRLSCRWREKL